MPSCFVLEHSWLFPVIIPLTNSHGKKELIIYTSVLLLILFSVAFSYSQTFKDSPNAYREKTHSCMVSIRDGDSLSRPPRQASLFFSSTHCSLFFLPPTASLSELLLACDFLDGTYTSTYTKSWLHPYPDYIHTLRKCSLEKSQGYLLVQFKVEIPAWAPTSLGKSLNLSEPLIRLKFV